MARAEKVKALTALHYEAGNQAKCYKAVWRHWIEPEFGICYRTYLNMLGLPPGHGKPPRHATIVI